MGVDLSAADKAVEKVLAQGLPFEEAAMKVYIRGFAEGVKACLESSSKVLMELERLRSASSSLTPLKASPTTAGESDTESETRLSGP